MPAGLPYFFFCYSRADIQDSEPYVVQLFEDLRKRVASIEGMAINRDDPERDKKLDSVGFRDVTGVRLGKDWKEAIGKAIQHNAVLVCLYSPNFFSQLETKQFCGKEVTAFLLRNREVHYIKAPPRGNEELELRGWRNIVPIFWERPSIMKGRQPSLPPFVLNAIQWTPHLKRPEDSSLLACYQDLGLRAISRRYRIKYRELVDLVAETIVEFARDPPPALTEVPDIENLRNVFWQPPHDAPLDAVTTVSPEPVLADVSLGPRHLLIIAVRHSAVTNTPWFPYAGEESIAAAVEQFAFRSKLAARWLGLDPSAPNFLDAALSAIRKVASHSGRVLLVGDPLILPDETSRIGLLDLLRQPCRAGLLVPADSQDEIARSIIEKYRDALHSADGSGNWIIRPTVGTIGDFHTAADSVASDLLAKISLADRVRQEPPDNDGPSERPRMANRLNDREAA
jgi:hypothetical protein